MRPPQLPIAIRPQPRPHRQIAQDPPASDDLRLSPNPVQQFLLRGPSRSAEKNARRQASATYSPIQFNGRSPCAMPSPHPPAGQSTPGSPLTDQKPATA